MSRNTDELQQNTDELRATEVTEDVSNATPSNQLDEIDEMRTRIQRHEDELDELGTHFSAMIVGIAMAFAAVAMFVKGYAPAAVITSLASGVVLVPAYFQNRRYFAAFERYQEYEREQLASEVRAAELDPAVVRDADNVLIAVPIVSDLPNAEASFALPLTPSVVVPPSPPSVIASAGAARVVSTAAAILPPRP